jgi:hypothetical protein
MLARIDDKICDLAQDGYCYLLDRFGLQIGDVVCILTIAQIITPRSMAGYGAALVCIALGCWVSALQRSGRHEHINRAAGLLRALRPLRLGLIGFAVYTVASGTRPLWDESLNVALVYLLTCKVRKRDEDRFRKRRAAQANA